MNEIDSTTLIEEFRSFISNKVYPCVAARAAVKREHLKCLVVDSMACPKDDAAILNFLYNFVRDYRTTQDSFYSAAIIFRGPLLIDEALFDKLLWQRLQSLSIQDAKNFKYDSRVNPNPTSPDFSFSLMEEAFFIVGMHPGSSRRTRRFDYPTLVFNPHAQFEELRQKGGYDKMKAIVRKRDKKYAGSINPMLKDFGEASEAYQYSGQQYASTWKCPLTINHGDTQHHSTPKRSFLSSEEGSTS